MSPALVVSESPTLVVVSAGDHVETVARIAADALLIPLAQRGAANGVATLDSGSKIPPAQLPALAINEIHTVASQAAMLALAANPGDIAIRSDVGSDFQLAAAPASVLSNWVELAFKVTSVFGRTGAVTLAKSDVTGTGLAAGDVGADVAGAAAAEASARATAVSAEASTRAAADTSNANAISAETSRAEAAESANASAITAEASRATAAEGLLKVGVNVLQYNDAAHAGSALQAAITAYTSALQSGAHVLLYFPSGSYTWDVTPKIPAGITGWLLIWVQGCLFTLTPGGVRWLDFGRTGNDQMFQHLGVEGWATLDGANLDGLALGAATAVAGSNVTIGSGATSNVVFADVSTYRTAGAVYVSSGANLGLTLAYTKVNGTTLAITNSTAGSITFTVADGITGSNRNHVILGTLVEAGTVDQSRMSFDRITLKKIRTINVPSSMTTGQTLRSNVAIGTVPRAVGEAFQSTTNILVEDVDLGGGNVGVSIGATGTATNAWHDQITVRGWRHTTGLVPTANVTGAHIQIGGTGYGGTCWVEDGWAEFSADVGIETDAMTVSNVTDVVTEDVYGNAFFSTNFNSPGQSTGTAGPTTATLANNAGSIDNSTPNIHYTGTIPDQSGSILIDNELITYQGNNGTLLALCQRGAAGTTAATHTDGATITVFDGRPQVVNYTRCHPRRTRISPPSANLCQAFATASLAHRPAPAIRLNDCTYFRRGADFVTAGEIMSINGATPWVEVDGLTAVIEGINHPSGANTCTGLNFVQPSNFTSTTFPIPLSLKRVKIHVSGTVQTNDLYNAIYVDRGVWHLDWDDVYVSMQLGGIGSSHTVAANFFSTATSYLDGRVRGLRVKSLNNGTTPADASPIGVRIPSTASCVVRGPLVFQGCDFRDLQNAGTYQPFNIDVTNAAQVVFRDTIHATALAPSAVTVTASPFTYQNLDCYSELVTVGNDNGPVTKVEISVDNSTFFDTKLTVGEFRLEPGWALRVTYTGSAPTMLKRQVL